MAIRLRQSMWVAVLGLAAVLAGQTASGEDSTAAEVPQPGLQTKTVAEYQAQIGTLRDLVSACRSDPQACHAEQIGSDDRVTDAGFNVHWGWLRELVVKAQDPKLQDRDSLLDTAVRRLNDAAREAGMPGGQAGPEANAVQFTTARAEADKVLSGAEFHKVTQSSWWQDFLARVAEWLDRRIERVASVGEQHRWLGPVIEWGFVAMALVAVLVWVQRVMKRQRLAIRLEKSAGISSWQEASRNWAAMAKAAADKGDWRDAVHSLYWASVTELEGRRVWRQNSARTPREHLRLLQADAPQYGPLRQLTEALERIWYGLAQAERVDYDTALRLYVELRVA